MDYFHDKLSSYSILYNEVFYRNPGLAYHQDPGYQYHMILETLDLLYLTDYYYF